MTCSAAKEPTSNDATGSNGVETKQIDVDNGRGSWKNHTEFILSLVGYSTGLGNVWRFPYLAYKNGGGAFLIPYVLSVIIAGLPLYFMELALGQYSSLGANRVFRYIAPVFQGVGWGMVVVSLLVALYYNMIIAWVLFYFFASFRSELIWSNCRHDWNTISCHSDLEDDYCRDVFNDRKAFFFNKTCHFANETARLAPLIASMRKVAPAEEFFNIYMLNISDSFENLGNISWRLVLCLAASWLLVFACICKGVQSSGKVVYFTATFPYVVLLILLIRGVTLDGAADGILFYIKPDLNKLARWQVWKDAAEQVFFSLGPAFGGLIAMASYNKFNNNCKRDAILVACIDSCTSTFAGFAIFSVAGFMAKQQGVGIQNVTASGMGLAFTAYPEAIVRLPVSPLWSVLFFFMLITLGLDSEFAMLETVTTAMMDEFPRLRPYKVVIVGGACFALFLFGLPFCTQAGVYIFQIINDYSAGYCVIFLSLVECVCVSYIYGIRRFLDDVGMMLGSPPRWYWMITLGGLTPVYMLMILIASFLSIEPSTYGSYVLPSSAQALGYVLSLLSILCVPIFAIYHIVRRLILKKPLRPLIQATPEWCPAHERGQKQKPGLTDTPSANIWSVTRV